MINIYRRRNDFNEDTIVTMIFSFTNGYDGVSMELGDE